MGFGDVLVTIALVSLTLFASMWTGIVLGLSFRSPDAVQGVGFTIVLPLTFMAGTVVTISGMDLVPGTIAEWNQSPRWSRRRQC
jgi:ABC-2 type transport system permease protein